MSRAKNLVMNNKRDNSEESKEADSDYKHGRGRPAKMMMIKVIPNTVTDSEELGRQEDIS